MAAIPKAYTNGIPQAIPQAPDANQAFSSVPQIPQAGGVPVPSAAAPSMQTPQVGVSQVPDYQNWDASAQFKLFQSAPDIGNQEMQRAVNQRNIYQASGDTPKMAAANDWIGKVGTVMSGVPKTPTPSPYTDQYRQVTNDYNDTYNQLKTQMKTPFAYNPQTDPQAQAYKGYYDNLANESSRNAMEAMNSRGLLNSSMTAGEVAKAQNDAQLQYGTKIADLGNQAYQRYQDQIGNQSRLLGLVGQSQDRAMQGLQNDRTYGLQQGEFGLKQNADARAAQGQAFDQSYKTNDQNFNQMAKTSELTGAYDPNAGVRQQMAANSAAYANASPEEQQRLHNENLQLAQSIGAQYNPQTGDYQFQQPTRTIQGQQLDLTRQDQMQRQAIQRTQTTGQVSQSDSQLLGVPVGTPTAEMLKIINDSQYRNAQLGLDSQRVGLDSQRIGLEGQKIGLEGNRLDWEKSTNNPHNQYLNSEINWRNAQANNYNNKATGNADTVAKSIDTSQYIQHITDPMTGTKKTVIADPKAVETMILSSGLPDTEMAKLYSRYGIPMGN